MLLVVDNIKRNKVMEDNPEGLTVYVKYKYKESDSYIVLIRMDLKDQWYYNALDLAGNGGLKYESNMTLSAILDKIKTEGYKEIKTCKINIGGVIYND